MASEYKFDVEFTPSYMLIDFEFTQCKYAAQLLGIDPTEVFAGNRHNTEVLDDLYEAVDTRQFESSVEVPDEFCTTLYLHEYNGMKVVLSSDYIGVFCSETVGKQLLGV